MNTPDIPTDDLYKFMAVAGLVIFLGSGFLHVQLDRERWTRWYDHIADFEVHEVRREALRTDMDQLRSRWSALAETLVDEPSGEAVSDFALFMRRSDRVLGDMEEIVETLDALHVRALELDEEGTRGAVEHEYLQQLDDQQRIVVWSLRFFAALGLATAVAGFILWYVKVQAPRDHALSQGESDGA